MNFVTIKNEQFIYNRQCKFCNKLIKKSDHSDSLRTSENYYELNSYLYLIVLFRLDLKQNHQTIEKFMLYPNYTTYTNHKKFKNIGFQYNMINTINSSSSLIELYNTLITLILFS